MAASRRTKKDVIADELKQLINTGELPRGARIQQDEIAARFATSITPVREALRQLTAEGLLVGEPHRGVRVAEADLEVIKGVYVARRLIEPYAAQRASQRVSRRDLDRAEELIEEMAAAARSGDARVVREANEQFHRLFYERCGIPSLTRIIDTLWLAFPWDVLQVLTSRVEDSVSEHRAMVAAMRAGDAEAVGTAFENHIRRSYMSLAEHLSGEEPDDPFDIGTD